MTGPALSERDLAVIRSFARRIDPLDAGANNNLGVLYHQKGLTAEAISCFLRALELDPRMQVARTTSRFPPPATTTSGGAARTGWPAIAGLGRALGAGPDLRLAGQLEGHR